ncbi:MAG: inositol monophosphatase [Hyphomicrobiales bacterium]|nr:inositol monophosphatase [Hyphomicrobiales bacterium]
MNKPSIIRVMEDAALKAGRRLIRDFGEVEKLQVSQKGPGDFVTEADTRTEKLLIDALSHARPEFGFLTEEHPERPAAAGCAYRWVIDPIDGTTNFLHGIPFFCISIGLEKQLPGGGSEIEAALIFAPVSNELFWAHKGGGAYLNDTRLLVSSRDKLQLATVGTGGLGVSRKDREKTLEATRVISAEVSAVRSLGSAALELAYVAAGRLEAYWHVAMQPWDIAAGILLVREARGMVTEIGGGSEMLRTGSLLASNSHLHNVLDKALHKIYKK